MWIVLVSAIVKYLTVLNAELLRSFIIHQYTLIIWLVLMAIGYELIINCSWVGTSNN